MLTFALLAGLWSTSCAQTQINGRSGWVTESYDITSSGAYRFERNWFKDKTCSDAATTDAEDGELVLKGPLDSFFNPNATAVDFTSAIGTDLGGLDVQGDMLKVARGLRGSSMRNTMLAVIGYKKQ